MKKNYRFLYLLAAGAVIASCSKEDALQVPVYNEGDSPIESVSTCTFAQPDDSKVLDGTPSENLKTLFEALGPDIIRGLGTMNITTGQYSEIKKFTDDLLTNYRTETAKYRVIFKWVSTNIKYNDYSKPDYYSMGNDPYEVFVNRVAVCQGYSNLMTVMCHTQGIPAVVVNGYYSNGAYDYGHAWAYTCPDGVWTVSDPTNFGTWEMKNTSAYAHLKPMQADADFFVDEVGVYNYFDYAVNVKEVLATSNPFVVPYSVGGFVINSFNPSVELSEDIAELYLGQNITTLGESYNLGLLEKAPHLQAVYVDEANPSLMGHKGVVYKKNGSDAQLCYIPGAMTFVELLPMKVVGKNTIYNHKSVEEIYFPKGTKRIEDSAIENCPKLKRVYVPVDAEVVKNAIYGCPADVEIVRGVPSGITNITMD